MTVGAFIVVRLSSSRLPNKAIMPILGKPMIQLMIERIQQSQLIDKVVITTSVEPSDEPLQSLAATLNVGCGRGSLENVMERINSAAKAYDCDTIVELLGDNPLIHPDLVDDLIKFYKDGGYDYVATVTKEYPISHLNLRLFSTGVRVQIYSQEACRQYINYPEYIKNEDKHPCSYIFEHPEKFKVGYFEAKGKWAFMNKPDLTFAVNYRKNFELIRTIFERNYPHNPNFSLQAVYEQLDKEKELYSLMGSEK